MGKIKGKDTLPELIVRRFLHAHGFRFRIHDKKIPGKPDIVLKKYKTIIDIRGCFWHSHTECQNGIRNKSPKDSDVTTNRNTAIQRDKLNMQRWKDMDWNVIVVWADCELQPRRKKSPTREETLNNILKQLEIANSNN